MESDKIISLKNAFKSFGKTEVLKGIDFELYKDEVLVLLGDNGAGKSTFIKCLSGLLRFDKFDEFYINNVNLKKYNINLKSLRKLGLEVVFQESSISPNQEIYRNIFATRHIKKFKLFIDKKAEIKVANEILKTHMMFSGVGLDASKTAINLSGGERQGLAIARAMYFNSNILILDEPTTALGVVQQKMLMEYLRSLKNTSIIFITHNFAKAYEIGDRFVFLQNGVISKSIKKSDISSLNNLYELAR